MQNESLKHIQITYLYVAVLFIAEWLVQSANKFYLYKLLPY